jgi:hypothetical protein
MRENTTTTRERNFAAHIEQLRQKHPMLGDSYWAAVWEKQRLQWQVEDLGNGIASLVGRYGYHARQDPENARLVELLAELAALIDQPAPVSVSGSSGLSEQKR